MKKLNYLIILSLITVLMAGIVYGAISCTFDQTATTVGTESTYLKGASKNLSVTIAGWTNDANSSVAVISAGATGCTITGALTFNTTTNTNQSYMNTTVNTLATKDDTTCTYTMTIKNASNQVTLTTCTRDFISDNTIPVLSSASPADNYLDTDGKQAFSVTCTNATGATLYIESRAYTMTESSDTCTYSATNLLNSKISWYIVATDGINTTTSSTYILEERKNSGGFIDETTGQFTTTPPPATEQKNVKGFVDTIMKGLYNILASIIGVFK